MIKPLKFNKKGIEMSFAWIFALIIGGVILFLALFFSGKIIETGTQTTQAELARNLDILLNPFSSIREVQVTLSKPVELPEKTEVNFSCSSIPDSNSGQTISVRLEKGKSPFVYSIKNKYIFAEDFNTENLWIFGKSFEMPWRVDDLTYVLSKQYCFVKAPAKISQELNDLNISMIKNVNSITDLKCKGAVIVCFQGASGTCNIQVVYGTKTVKKGNVILHFLDDATMYAAIFDSKNYDCNIKRLMKRLKVQAEIFIQKANLLSEEGCQEIEYVRQELLGMQAVLSASQTDYANAIYYASRIDDKNPIKCPLF